MRTLVVWHNLNNDTYYYKIVRILNSDYYEGYTNGYNHQIILILTSNVLQPIKTYVSLRYLLLTPVIRLLKLITGFLEKINIKY